MIWNARLLHSFVALRRCDEHAAIEVGQLPATRSDDDLGQLADRVRDWSERDVAIVAPGLGYGDPAGVGPFLLHLWGMLAEHERGRLLGRVIPGMHARLAAGLPLGRQPLGYRVDSAASVPGQRPRRHLVPDPDIGPIITALFAQAAAHPDWGDRRMADWAAERWPELTWSHGRIRGILSNEVYAGVLRGRLLRETVLLLDNHPPLVDPVQFAHLQTLRRQRATDAADGVRAVGVTSWLGGIARCERCGGQVTWRSDHRNDPSTAGSGSAGGYRCTGGAPPHRHGCEAAWSSDSSVTRSGTGNQDFIHHVLGLLKPIRAMVAMREEIHTLFNRLQRPVAAPVRFPAGGLPRMGRQASFLMGG